MPGHPQQVPEESERARQRIGSIVDHQQEAAVQHLDTAVTDCSTGHETPRFLQGAEN